MENNKFQSRDQVRCCHGLSGRGCASSRLDHILEIMLLIALATHMANNSTEIDENLPHPLQITASLDNVDKLKAGITYFGFKTEITV